MTGEWVNIAKLLLSEVETGNVINMAEFDYKSLKN